MDILISPVAILIYIFAGIPIFFAYSIYKKTRPGYINAIFLDATDTLKSRRVKLSEDGKSFSAKHGKKSKKYTVSESCIYRVGTFRIPTSYYTVGKIPPLDFNKMVSADSLSAEDYFEATEGNVIRQALQAFENSVLTITSSTILVAIIVIAANGFVFMQINTILDEIKLGLGIGE